MFAIQAQNVSKKYKNGIQALDGLSLNVREGEIFSLLGQNGAGKSTLIRLLTTYLKPDSGKVQMLGNDLLKEAAAIRPQIACVAQQTSIDTYLSLEENMMFQSRLYQIPKARAKQRMEKLICDFCLQSYRKYPVDSYSGGIKRPVSYTHLFRHTLPINWKIRTAIRRSMRLTPAPRPRLRPACTLRRNCSSRLSKKA